MNNFKDKIIVITGAGSGIGRALAIKFADLGAKLALNDFNKITLKETISLLKKEEKTIFYSDFDVSDRASFFKFSKDVVAYFGAVDVVINNAGLAMNGTDFETSDLDIFDRIMDVNFTGVLNGSRAFIPYLLKRPKAVLVNISSVYGLTGIAMGEAYVASKFAVNGLTQSLMQVYKKTNLSVHCVYPGGIQTNITKNSLNYDQKAAELFDTVLIHTPEYAAKTIIKGIKKRTKRILIGNDARTVEYLSRIAPVFGCGLINKKLEPLRVEYKKQH